MLTGLRTDAMVLRFESSAAALSAGLPHDGFGLVVCDLHNAGAFVELGALRAYFPVTPLMAVVGSDAAGVEACRLGATGYLPRSFDQARALASLRGIIDFSCNARSIETIDDPPKIAGANLPPLDEFNLTRRERQVFELLSRGLNNRGIAGALKIAEPTARIYVSAILRKLRVGNRSEAQLVAFRLGQLGRFASFTVSDAEQALAWIAPYCSERNLCDGELVCVRGERARALYLIRSGSIVLQEVEMTLGCGDVFGELCLFEPARACAVSAISVSPTQLLALDQAQLNRLVYTSPLFAVTAMQFIAARIAARCHSAVQALAHAK
jgi:DNA-binding NarL/FixJ family response regulator